MRTPAAPARARRRRWPQRLLIALVLLVAVRVALPYGLRWAVERYGPSFVRGTFALRDVSLGLLVGRVRLDGFALVGEGLGPEPVLAFTTVDLQWQWGSVLAGRPRVRRLLVEGLRARGRRAPDGTIDVLALIVPREAPPPEPSAWNFGVLDLTLRDVELRWRDEALDPARDVLVALPELGVTDGVASQEIGGPVRFTVARVTLTPDVSTSAAARDLALALSLEVLDAHHEDAFPVRVAITSAHGEIDADVELSLAPLAADGRLALAGVDIPAWLENLVPAHAPLLPAARLSGNLHVAFEVGLPLRADGTLRLDGVALALDGLDLRLEQAGLALTSAAVPLDGEAPLTLDGKLDVAGLRLERDGSTSEVGTATLELTEVTADQARALEARWALAVTGARHEDPALTGEAGRLALDGGALVLPLAAGAPPLRVATRLAITDGAFATDALDLRWASLTAELRELVAPAAGAPTVALGAVRLEQPVVAITLPSLGADENPERAEESRERADEGGEGAAPAAAAGTPTIAVDAFDVVGGEIVVAHPDVLGEQTRRLRGVEVGVRDLHWPAATVGSADVLVGGLGEVPLHVEGRATEDGSQWRVQADRVALVPFAPYADRYSAYTLEAGALSLSADVQVDAAGIDAPLEISFHDLAVGGGSDDAPFVQTFGIPLQLAIELLQDPGGDIDLSVPISSRGGATDVGLGPVVAGALRSALLGALTSPLKLLGAVFGASGEVAEFEEPIVRFARGSAAIDDAAAEAIAPTLALLGERASLGVTLAPRLAARDQVAETVGEDGSVTRRSLAEAELQALARARVDATRAWLQARGIAPERIAERPWDGALVPDEPAVALHVGLLR